MAERSSEWIHETTLSGQARDFWWRRDPDGGLTVLRRVKAGRGRHRDQTQTLAAAELDRLLAFMADGAWHRAATSALTRPGAEPDSIAVFFHRELGWTIHACAVAAHLAVVLLHAGLWEWDGRKKGMAFRQVSADVGTLDAYAAGRRAQAAEPGRKPEPRPRRAQQAPAVDLWARWRALSRGLQARLDELEAGGRHAADKGARREAVVRDFLADHLPDDYAVTAGEVVASTGEASGQTDVLIYDRRRSPRLIESAASMVLPAESIYAAIEIKPRLHGAGVREACATLGAIKALPRHAVRGFADGAPPNPPVFTAVISIEAVDRRFLADLLRQAQDKTPHAHWVDAVLVLGEVLVYRYGGPGGILAWAPEPMPVAPPLVARAAGHDSLFLFWQLLLTALAARPLRPPDLAHYLFGADIPPEEFL